MSDHPESFQSMARGLVVEAIEELLPRLLQSGVPIVPQWLSPVDAGIYCGYAVKSLEQLRRLGGGPRYSKCGHLIRYNRDDIDAWMRSLEVAQ